MHSLQYPATIYVFTGGRWVSAGQEWIEDKAHARAMFAPYMAVINSRVIISWKDKDSIIIGA